MRATASWPTTTGPVTLPRSIRCSKGRRLFLPFWRFAPHECRVRGASCRPPQHLAAARGADRRRPAAAGGHVLADAPVDDRGVGALGNLRPRLSDLLHQCVAHLATARDPGE